MRIVLGVFSLTVVSVTTVLVCIPLYVMGVVRLVVPNRAVKQWLAHPMDSIIDVWVSVFRWLIQTFNLIKIEIEMPAGLADRNRWQVIVCNHQSWVDIIILQTSFRDVVPVLKFFTKRELIWVPFVGVAMWFLGFPYVYRAKTGAKQLSDAQREQNDAVLRREGRRFLDKPVAVINFVEGTRFSRTKRDSSGSPFQNLLKPRRGGLRRTLLVLDSRVQHILNSTITYPGKPPGFWQLLSGQTTTALLSVTESTNPGTDESQLTEWLNEEWTKKDRLISSYVERLSR